MLWLPINLCLSGFSVAYGAGDCRGQARLIIPIENNAATRRGFERTLTIAIHPFPFPPFGSSVEAWRDWWES
jgi:hypothetical protein